MTELRHRINDSRLMLSKMNRTFIILTAIFIAGSIIATAYASNTIIDNTSVSTTTVNTVDLHVSGTCTGCGGASEGSFSSYNTVVLNTTTTKGDTHIGSVLV